MKPLKKSKMILERTEYKKARLDETSVSTNPFIQFENWLKDALNANLVEPNAMTLSTVTVEGKPTARVVLLKEYNQHGFVFFTNYESRKGQELERNKSVVLTFFWAELERQIRIEGTSEKLNPMDSDTYFAMRPRGSQIGAWASQQSQPVENRQALEERYLQFEQKFARSDVPRPPHWGGYLVTPDYFEFWQGRPNRFHDRIIYSKAANDWKVSRIAP